MEKKKKIIVDVNTGKNYLVKMLTFHIIFIIFIFWLQNVTSIAVVKFPEKGIAFGENPVVYKRKTYKCNLIF